MSRSWGAERGRGGEGDCGKEGGGREGNNGRKIRMESLEECIFDSRTGYRGWDESARILWRNMIR